MGGGGGVHLSKQCHKLQVMKKLGTHSANHLYDFHISSPDHSYVTAAKRLSENELYDLSVQREPSHR